MGHGHVPRQCVSFSCYFTMLSATIVSQTDKITTLDVVESQIQRMCDFITDS